MACVLRGISKVSEDGAVFVDERALALGLGYEKSVWTCGCFWLTKKQCGKDGGYRWIFGSGTRLLVRPGE